MEKGDGRMKGVRVGVGRWKVYKHCTFTTELINAIYDLEKNGFEVEGFGLLPSKAGFVAEIYCRRG